MSHPLNLSVVSWNLLNGAGLKLTANYAELKRAFSSSVIQFDNGWVKAHEESKRRGLPWKSYNKFKKVIIDIIANDLARWEGTRLVLTSKKESAQMHSKKESVRHRFLKLERSMAILPQMQSELVKSGIRRIAFSVNSKKSQNKKTAAKLSKNQSGLLWNVSLKQIANWFNVSASTAKRILSQISENYGICVEKSVRKLVTFCSFNQWENRFLWWKDKKNAMRCDVNSCFWCRGIIWYQPKTRIGIGIEV